MAQNDLHNITKKTIAVPLASFIADGTTDGIILDTSFFSSIEFVMIVGEITVIAFTLTLVLQHSDTDQGGDFVNVPDDQILGDPALAFIDQANDDSTTSLGYIGAKRFVRAQMVAANAGGGEGTLFAGTLLVSDHARHVPFAPLPA